MHIEPVHRAPLVPVTPPTKCTECLVSRSPGDAYLAEDADLLLSLGAVTLGLCVRHFRQLAATLETYAQRGG